MKKYLPLLLIVLAVMSLGLSKHKTTTETAQPAQQEQTAAPETAAPASEPAAAPASEESAVTTPMAPETAAGSEAESAEAAPPAEEAAPAETAAPTEPALEDFTVAASKKNGMIMVKVFSKQYNSIATATLVDPKNQYDFQKVPGYFATEVPITPSMSKAGRYNCKVYVKDQQGRTLFKKVEINL